MEQKMVSLFDRVLHLFQTWSLFVVCSTAAYQSELLQRHIPRVSRSIAKVIKNLDHIEVIEDYLQVLGKIHNQNGIFVSENGILNSKLAIPKAYYVLLTVEVLGHEMRSFL